MIFSETAHLRIRGYQDSDLDTLVQLFSDPNAQRGAPAMFVPKSETQLKSSLPGVVEKFLMFCVLEIKEAGHDMAGFVGLMAPGPVKNRSASFAIGVVEEHRGKGYGTEATRWAVNHAFSQLGLHRVSLVVLSDNPRAISVYQSVGFAEEGRDREANFQDGRWWDLVHMGILEKEWTAKSLVSG